VGEESGKKAINLALGRHEPTMGEMGDVVNAVGGAAVRQWACIHVISIFMTDMRYVFIAPPSGLSRSTLFVGFLCTIPAADVLQIGSQIRITF